ncbi:hypothetical protein LCGC14_2874680 [marine sediment metagenome]|uniref:DNA endonuclease I-HmuI-like NUMOD-like domain-containing protein n=1 Tax=marine sediment metagenome TaxID=412755 RepID=A0A0F8YNM5_9ZZZZ
MKLENQVVSPSGRKLRGGGYHAIHKWLIKHYGKANKCQNPLCDKTRNKFHYALLKNKKHEHTKTNYIMLCTRCHFNYDITIEKRKRQAASLRDRKHSEKHKINISKGCNGIHKGNQHSAKIVIQYDGKTRSHIRMWNSISQASKKLDISLSNISMCCNGKLKTAGGFIWRFLNKPVH